MADRAPLREAVANGEGSLDIVHAVTGSIRRHAERTAIADAEGEHTFAELGATSEAIARGLTTPRGGGGLAGARVALSAEPGFGWVAACVGIWRAGGVVVPLCATHPPPELDHVIGDSGTTIVVTDLARLEELAPIADRRRATLVPLDDLLDPVDPTDRTDGTGPADETALARAGEDAATGDTARAGEDAAMILYTSGTTGRPKGVILTRSNLAAQAASLVEAWAWTPDDRLVHALPLHHTHGIVNGLLCALVSGASCRMLAGFDAAHVWRALAGGPATLFFGVPTMYHRLVEAWEEADAEERRRWADAAAGLRLAVSGSAALPVPLFERWREISGQALLERYGMTEIGMALSNPLEGERRPGTVGRPLPGIEVRRVDPEGRPVETEGVAGEIEVRGPGVFDEYHERPEETRAAFRDGWFRTGDEATVEDGYWRILGRRSVDIVKSGGEKVSALEVESALLAHPAIAECAVVGVPDPEWGERVCAAVVAAPGAEVELDELRDWGRRRIAPWKLPRDLAVVDALPRNAMGKVTKPAVGELFAPRQRAPSDDRTATSDDRIASDPRTPSHEEES
ncbi:MAG: acyl-CoA synthetase [Gemmatimonadota bacterium]|nr:acyl-CoA synthetase [Gemmatimonadota bacterium]